jgi:hypothetical protein
LPNIDELALLDFFFYCQQLQFLQALFRIVDRHFPSADTGNSSPSPPRQEIISTTTSLPQYGTQEWRECGFFCFLQPVQPPSTEQLLDRQ